MARRQLLEGGVGPDAIKERTRSGLLVVLHRGVYCLGKPTERSFLRAALLATGNGAVLSHASAAWVLGLEEGAFLELCRRGDIPQPILNAPLVLPSGRKSSSMPSGEPSAWRSSSTAGPPTLVGGPAGGRAA